MLAARNVLFLLVAGSFLAVSVLSQNQNDGTKFGDKCYSNNDCHFNGSICALDRNNNDRTRSCQCKPEYVVTNHTTIICRPLSGSKKKFGDPCDFNEDCNFNGSMCSLNNSNKKSLCQCRYEYEVTNHIDKCGNRTGINQTCFFNEQCENELFLTECKDNICSCRFERTAVFTTDGRVECVAKNDSDSVPYTDPAMLCVLGGMCLMFIIICVVLRLFSKARWRENRTIFNTPNPRLMNVSLLRDNKPPPGAAGERRGSKSSTKTHSPSRQPSMASLKPQSPSLGGRGVRGNNGGGGANAETVIRSPTTKTPMALPTEPKTYVAVDMQQPAV